MGRISKSDIEQFKLDNIQQTVLELNEGNVENLFNKCQADDEEKKDRKKIFLSQVLIPDLTQLQSNFYYLSKPKINKYKNTILYLLGQLKSSHNNDDEIVFSDGIIRYNNSAWTKNSDYLLKFYSLISSTGYIGPFMKKGDIIVAPKSIQRCFPTLSPKDPNFDKWYKEVYEPKMRKLKGQEPEGH